MKVVILAGGRGSRLSEETVLKPKPMVEIGGRPILWHIMHLYAARGFNEFAVALGYRGEVIKEYFLNYYSLNADVAVDLSTGAVEHVNTERCDWRVHLVDTGLHTMTGGRVARLAGFLRPEGTFMLTYGDGVSDVDPGEVLAFHRAHGKLATLVAVRPPTRFGAMDLGASGEVRDFQEKPQTGEGWINGGFFVMQPDVLDYLGGDDCILERQPLQNLSRDGQLMAYRHDGFWQCMDTVRDHARLEELWAGGDAPWKVWA